MSAVIKYKTKLCTVFCFFKTKGGFFLCFLRLFFCSLSLSGFLFFLFFLLYRFFFFGLCLFLLRFFLFSLWRFCFFRLAFCYFRNLWRLKLLLLWLWFKTFCNRRKNLLSRLVLCFTRKSTYKQQNKTDYNNTKTKNYCLVRRNIYRGFFC